MGGVVRNFGNGGGGGGSPFPGYQDDFSRDINGSGSLGTSLKVSRGDHTHRLAYIDFLTELGLMSADRLLPSHVTNYYFEQLFQLLVGGRGKLYAWLFDMDFSHYFNNETLLITVRDSSNIDVPFIFELKLDGSFVPTPGFTTVDCTTATDWVGVANAIFQALIAGGAFIRSDYLAFGLVGDVYFGGFAPGEDQLSDTYNPTGTAPISTYYPMQEYYAPLNPLFDLQRYIDEILYVAKKWPGRFIEVADDFDPTVGINDVEIGGTKYAIQPGTIIYTIGRVGLTKAWMFCGYQQYMDTYRQQWRPLWNTSTDIDLSSIPCEYSQLTAGAFQLDLTLDDASHVIDNVTLEELNAVGNMSSFNDRNFGNVTVPMGRTIVHWKFTLVSSFLGPSLATATMTGLQQNEMLDLTSTIDCMAADGTITEGDCSDAAFGSHPSYRSALTVGTNNLPSIDIPVQNGDFCGGFTVYLEGDITDGVNATDLWLRINGESLSMFSHGILHTEHFTNDGTVIIPTMTDESAPSIIGSSLINSSNPSDFNRFKVKFTMKQTRSDALYRELTVECWFGSDGAAAMKDYSRTSVLIWEAESATPITSVGIESKQTSITAFVIDPIYQQDVIYT